MVPDSGKYVKVFEPAHVEGCIKGAHLVPMLQPFICTKFSSLNTKLFKVNISVRKVLITFDRMVSPGLARELKKVLMDSIPSSLGIFVYRDLTSMVTRIVSSRGSSGRASNFLMRSVV